MTITLLVPFLANLRGLRRLDFAATLALVLGKKPEQTVEIRVRTPDLGQLPSVDPDLVREEHKRVVAFVRAHYGEAHDLLLQIEEPGTRAGSSLKNLGRFDPAPPHDTFLIEERPVGNIPRRYPTLFSCGETSWSGRGEGSVLVPIGDRESGLRALEQSMALLRALEKPIIFYHSTWKNPASNSRDPHDHMCDEAVGILNRCQELATKLFMTHRTIIECADGVVEGIRRAALRTGCNLIVVARGERAGYGSYADELAKTSPVPVLYFNRVQS